MLLMKQKSLYMGALCQKKYVVCFYWFILNLLFIITHFIGDK